MKNGQDGEQIVVRGEEQFSDKSPMDIEWHPFSARRADWKHAHCKKGMSSMTQFSCTGARALDSVSASKFWEENAEGVMRNDTAGQSIDIEWHECPVDIIANTAHAARIIVGNWART